MFSNVFENLHNMDDLIIYIYICIYRLSRMVKAELGLALATVHDPTAVETGEFVADP